jgi:hypothetical protein
MRERIFRFGGGKRRRRLLLAVVVSAAALGVFAITSALAVHDEEFQLDGNVIDDAGPPQDFDWANFFNSSGAELPLPANFTASSFDRDFSTNANGSFSTADNTTFATGSKDTLAITPGWQCNQDNNVNSKDDIMNAYATSYEDPVSGDEILYFAMERNANTGTADVGFWFLQDENVNCESPGGSTAFTGDHADGDLLVVAEFTQGGTVSTVQVYRWAGGANGSLNPNPVASGVDCRTTAGGDTVCGRVNLDTITTPWQTANKQDGVGNSLRVSEFFEAGLNLTDSNLGDRCFNTFLADTRSSTSLTATLFDYSRGQLGQCTSETETTPSVSEETIPADGTIEVTDEATVTVTGVDTFSGEVKFFICGPIATGTCSPGTGDQLGAAKPVTTSPATVTSDVATITEAGRYCWRAEFSGDADVGVPPSEDSRETECFVINPRPTELVTQAGRPSPVDFGDPVTDTATLSNTANQPGTGGIGANGSINPTTPGGPANGTITFTLFKANCTDLATGTGTNPQTVSVSGDGTYGPVSFTPDAPGTYHWVAEYDGDSPNTLASDSPACGVDPNESVEVRQVPTEISTAQKVFPNDSATITSTVPGENLPAGGEVVFRLYGPQGGQSALQNCLAHGDTVGQGGLLYKETDTNVGGSPSVTTDTNNTTVSVDADSSVFWRVTYDPKDSAFTGRQSDCVENVALDFTNDGGPGTLFP